MLFFIGIWRFCCFVSYLERILVKAKRRLRFKAIDQRPFRSALEFSHLDRCAFEMFEFSIKIDYRLLK